MRERPGDAEARAIVEGWLRCPCGVGATRPGCVETVLIPEIDAALAREVEARERAEAERDEALAAMASDGADAVRHNAVLRSRVKELAAERDALAERVTALEAALRETSALVHGYWKGALRPGPPMDAAWSIKKREEWAAALSPPPPGVDRPSGEPA